MNRLLPVRRALLSVSDKTDLIPFARALTDLGIEIVSTGGTHKALVEAGLEPIAIEELTGFPEMMDGPDGFALRGELIWQECEEGLKEERNEVTSEV